MTFEKAPEKIWTTGNERTGSWNAEEVRMKAHMPDGWQTEYTRSDIAKADWYMRAEVKRLEEEILTLNRLVNKLYIDIAEGWIV
tara:strand:+ start:104 stop:355 length:252 start_codon:yes stop_codon:yes gene_type:complete